MNQIDFEFVVMLIAIPIALIMILAQVQLFSIARESRKQTKILAAIAKQATGMDFESDNQVSGAQRAREARESWERQRRS